MTEDQKDWELFKMVNEKHRFAIQVASIDGPVAVALVRGFDKEWWNLIDVSPIADVDGIFRIFRLTDAGKLRQAVLERQFGAGRSPS